MQTKKESLVETLTNVVTGFLLTLILSPVIYWIAGVELKVMQMGSVTLMFTTSSVLRSYIVRRWFNKSERVVECVPSPEDDTNWHITGNNKTITKFVVPVGNTDMTKDEIDKFINDLTAPYEEVLPDFYFHADEESKKEVDR